jgi:hypothetical protein
MFLFDGDLRVPWFASVDGRHRTFEQGLDEPGAPLFKVRDLAIDGFEPCPLNVGDLVARAGAFD